jgi:hypothetical protein
MFTDRINVHHGIVNRLDYSKYGSNCIKMLSLESFFEIANNIRNEIAFVKHYLPGATVADDSFEHHFLATPMNFRYLIYI